MKKVLLVLGALFTFAQTSQALVEIGIPTPQIPNEKVAANFGAFAVDGKLYVTTLGDSCNALSAIINIPANCDGRRPTPDYITSCGVELLLMQTELACFDDKLVPVTTVIELNKTKLDPSVVDLFIQTPNSTPVKVKLK